MASPFKDKSELESEIIAFINKHKETVANQAQRISAYFEMCCFNYIVRFYELNEYSLTIQNLQNGEYKYKCSVSGIHENFSHFRATINLDNTSHEFDILHNIAVESSHEPDIFVIPDISVVKSESSRITTDYYHSRKRLSFVRNEDLMTFCEAKHFTPFPELIFNFVGVVNELRNQILTKKEATFVPVHIAPSLMISGKPNKQTARIKDSLEGRYCINIIYDLFYSAKNTFSKRKIKELRTAGQWSKNVKIQNSLLTQKERPAQFW